MADVPNAYLINIYDGTCIKLDLTDRLQFMSLAITAKIKTETRMTDEEFINAYKVELADIVRQRTQMQHIFKNSDLENFEEDEINTFMQPADHAISLHNQDNDEDVSMIDHYFKQEQYTRSQQYTPQKQQQEKPRFMNPLLPPLPKLGGLESNVYFSEEDE